MKEMFKWCFPKTPAQIREIWDNGILTVDTNVLLDLYRYHQNTREALLESLNLFSGRAWLSNQVAEEFFRNRNSVILSSTSSFNEAEKNINEIRKVIEEPIKKIKSNRTISESIGKAIELSFEKTLSDASKEIEELMALYPDYLKSDSVLENIYTLFNSNVGDAFDQDSLVEIHKEAKRRIDNEIPPGFKDNGKKGAKPYGDYILWRQILDFVKKAQKPLILVTSEEKEDWWEKSSGKIVGPLYELLKEFHLETGQPFLLYRTARFLEYSLEKAGKQTNQEAVEEIREFAELRFRTSALFKIIGQKEFTNTPNRVTGHLIVELLEPAYKFTCTGHFNPHLLDIPDLKVKLVEAPMGLPTNLLRFGTGTTFDFHIHFKSMDFGTYLPTGIYTFLYEAQCMSALV
jgi:hypothetical protein